MIDTEWPRGASGGRVACAEFDWVAEQSRYQLFEVSKARPPFCGEGIKLLSLMVKLVKRVKRFIDTAREVASAMA